MDTGGEGLATITHPKGSGADSSDGEGSENSDEGGATGGETRMLPQAETSAEIFTVDETDTNREDLTIITHPKGNGVAGGKGLATIAHPKGSSVDSSDDESSKNSDEGGETGGEGQMLHQVGTSAETCIADEMDTGGKGLATITHPKASSADSINDDGSENGEDYEDDEDDQDYEDPGGNKT
jgi:hypothetical protein